MVKVINRSNGAPAEFTNEKWEELQKNPKWAKVWREVEPKKKPIEAVKLAEAKKDAEGKPSKNTDADKTAK